MAILAAPAGAVTITLGPTDLSASDPFAQCDLSCSSKVFVPTELPGATLVSPADGTITSWRVKGAFPQRLRLRVVQTKEGGRFGGVMTSGIADAGDGSGSTPAAIGIKAGEQLGIELSTDWPNAKPMTLSGTAYPGASWSAFETGLPDGETASPTSTATGSTPLFNATVELHKPLIALMSSTQGPASGGDAVVLTGQHLAVVQGVEFGGAQAQIIKADNNQVIALSPAHAPGTVEVTVNTAGGSSTDSTADQYTYVPDAPVADLAPKLWELKLSPRRFEAAGKGPSAKASAATGTKVSFNASEASQAKFTVQRRIRGSWVKVPGSFTRKAVPGLNSFRFTGRLKGKALPPGNYRLLAQAKDAQGQPSQQLRRSFGVVG